MNSLANYNKPLCSTIILVVSAMSNSKKTDEQLLISLRKLRREHRNNISQLAHASLIATKGRRIADAIATTMGSWRFIVIQSIILAIWIILNITAYIERWDPYPFILLNLALSFQSAYAMPFILMSQNKQQDIANKAAKNDYQINIKAELEIELLHQKIDQLREVEILNLTQAVKDLTKVIHKAKLPLTASK